MLSLRKLKGVLFALILLVVSVPVALAQPAVGAGVNVAVRVSPEELSGGGNANIELTITNDAQSEPITDIEIADEFAVYSPYWSEIGT